MKKWIVSVVTTGILAGVVGTVAFVSTPNFRLPADPPDDRRKEVHKGYIPSQSGAQGTKTEEKATSNKEPSYIVYQNKMLVDLLSTLKTLQFTEIDYNEKNKTYTAIRQDKNGGAVSRFEHVMGTDVIWLNGEKKKMEVKSTILDNHAFISFEIYQVVAESRKTNSLATSHTHEDHDESEHEHIKGKHKESGHRHTTPAKQ